VTGRIGELRAMTREEILTARLRCYQAEPEGRADRPHCGAVGVVAYGSIVLCKVSLR
jgi:hypothetical protein